MAPTTITNVRIFDGETVLATNTVTFEDGIISNIGSSPSPGSNTINGTGMTLLPGLIDSHVHTRLEHLTTALRFGVTTELEMMGHWTPDQREHIAKDMTVADLRTADFGLTAVGGHPSELHKFVKRDPPPGSAPNQGPPTHKHGAAGPGGVSMPTAGTVEEAVAFVKQRIADGADYIKIMLEEGTLLDSPGLPMLPSSVLIAAVDEAHAHSKLVLAHALTAATTLQAVELGVDGLAHLFIDQAHTASIVSAIKARNVFVTPCLVLNASIIGHVPHTFACDPRVSSKLSSQWLTTLHSSFNTYPSGNLQSVFSTTLLLHRAGVDILVGTDASMPVPELGGLAHGASVHHEMQMLVYGAGLTSIEALRAATSVPARRFGLNDRGRIEVGRQADLLLVEGDPSSDIGASLNVKHVWRKGAELAT